MRTSKKMRYLTVSLLSGLFFIYVLTYTREIDIDQSELLFAVQTDKASYLHGEMVKISGTVHDSASQPITHASVGIEVRDSRNNTIFLDIVYSLDNGSYEDNFRLHSNSPTGIYPVYATASTPGYPTAMNQTSFTVTLQTGRHDVATINVKLWKAVVGQGFAMKINMTIQNQGDFPETFNVTTYADLTMPIGDDITIGKQTLVNLASGENMTLVIIWNTAPTTPKGVYTISATADAVQGETDTADNNFIDGLVQVTTAGDVTGPMKVPDDKVDILDIAAIANCFGTQAGHPSYVPEYDINCDDKIDIRDIAIAAKNYGK